MPSSSGEGGAKGRAVLIVSIMACSLVMASWLALGVPATSSGAFTSAVFRQSTGVRKWYGGVEFPLAIHGIGPYQPVPPLNVHAVARALGSKHNNDVIDLALAFVRFSRGCHFCRFDRLYLLFD